MQFTSATFCRFGVLFALFCFSAFGQTYTGTITGVVSDTQGAKIAGAKVTLTNLATRETRVLDSNEEGRYTFAQLQPGLYSIQITMSGFQESVTNNIELIASQTREVNSSLAVGQVSERIEVTAEVTTIDTQTANQQASLGSTAVQGLPMIARNPLVLFQTQAGVVSPRTGISGSTSDQNQNRYSINGGRDEQVLVLVDGIPMTAGDWGGALAAPGADSVQEFQIMRNAFDARFGRTGGGVISMVTRGGSQQVHFGAWEYLRNSKLDANSFFNNRNAVAKGPFRRNTFGGNLAAPIWRKKRIYGFYGTDFLREAAPSTRISTLPTDLERSGDFSRTLNGNGTPVTLYDPATTRPDPANPGKFIREPFPGNRVPSARLDTVAVNVLKALPSPTGAGRTPAALDNYVNGSLASRFSSDRYDGRVDWVRTDRHSLFARFTKSPQTNTPPVAFDPSIENVRRGEGPRWSAGLGNTFVVNPTTVLTVLLGAAKFTEANIPFGYGYDVTRLGFPAALAAQFDVPQPPQFQLANYLNLGSQAYSIAARSLMSYGAHASKQLSRHSLKAGFYMDRYFLSLIETTSANFSFDRFFTAGPDPDVRGNINSGNTIASFLLGTGSTGNAPRYARPTSTHTHWNAYFQDSWNATPRLTVNLGIRWEWQRARTERYNQLNWFDFNADSPLAPAAGIPGLKGGLRWVDENNRFQWNAPKTDFAPRVGLAYRIKDKIVWRGGYGIFFVPTVNLGPLGNDGYSLDNTWISSLDNGRTPTNYLRNPYPNGLAAATGRSAGLATAVGFSIRSFQHDRPSPYMQQFSTDVQVEVAKDWIAEAGYAGSRGRKLAYGYNGFYAGMNLNQIPDSALSLGNALNDQVRNPFFGIITSGPLAQSTVLRRQLLRPYPQFQDVAILDMPGATSSFNAFTLRLNKRFANGMTLMASYQHSRAYDNASENQGWEVGDRFRNVYNLAQEWSVSAHDQPDSFALTYVYELPVGKGRTLGKNLHPVAEAVLGGWQMGAIWKIDSGLPLIFSAPNNVFNYNQWQFPNIKQGVSPAADNRNIDRWFNTSAFEQPAPFTYGDAPRFVDGIRYSRGNNWDMNLAKNFKIWERLRLQYRAEMYNALNRVQFGRANSSFGDSNFGRVTGTAPGNGPRTIQMALRLTF
jgi:hypothetical protein